MVTRCLVNTPHEQETQLRHEAEGTPRWVKVFGVVALVLVVLFVILLLTGRGGGHGPRRHAVPVDPGTPAAGVAAAHAPPAAAHTPR